MSRLKEVPAVEDLLEEDSYCLQLLVVVPVQADLPEEGHEEGQLNNKNQDLVGVLII